MKAKTAMLVGLVLSIAAMAEATPIDSNAIVQDGIEYYMQTDKSVYDLGEEVEMLYRVTNLGDEEVTFSMPGKYRDFFVEKERERIWDTKDEPVVFAHVRFTLSPLESIDWIKIWDMTYNDGDGILPGNYTVIGVLYYPGPERYVPVSVSIKVIPETATTYYVDALNGDDDNDGLSWEDAFKHLQDALAAASSSDEIRVAEGIYKPDKDTIHPGGSGDREATFQLISGAAIYGGYAGSGEPDPNARNIELYETILSGDLSGNDRHVSNPRDLSNDPCRAENSYNVVTGSGTDANAILDGFTITAGYNDFEAPIPPSGGGMLNREGSPTVRNCTFSNNMALVWGLGFGGGMYNYNSSATIINCTFSGNSAGAGGGMHNRTWRSNNKTVVVNCTFIGNYAKGEGGGVRNYTSSPIITNCTFSGNSAGDGGGMFNNYNCTPMVTNCSFSGNIAVKDGGGICNENNPYHGDSTPIVTNCILWNNSDSNGVDEYAQICGGIPTVNYNCIQGWTGALGGTGNIDADPLFADADGDDDVAGTQDDNLRLLAVSPCIDAGDNTAVPADTTDLDNDGNTTEPIPFDLDGNPRIVDGNDDGITVVDMGAFEVLSLLELIEEAIIEKAEALQKINAALEKELEAYETLGEILESGDYGDWNREAILGARWNISIAIFYEEDYIKKVLEKNIDKLQRTLSVLGVETNESNDGDIPVPSVGAYNPAALSLHQLVINLIEEALAEKAEALERIDAALEKEVEVYELLEQLLINRDYGDLNRQDILRAKSRIYVAIKYEEYLKKVLMIMTVEKLEDSLSRLAAQASQATTEN